MSVKGNLKTEIRKDIFRTVFVANNLLEHDISLRLEVVLVEARVEQNFQYEREHLIELLDRTIRMKAGELAIRIGIQLTTHALGETRNINRRLVARPLKEQMLAQMGEAPLFSRFVARPTPNKKSQRR